LVGLVRLLTLLTNYLKVEIGTRLLGYIEVIADDAVLQKVSLSLVAKNPAMNIVAAIFNILHLLPPAATPFIELLVNKVLNLEVRLRRTSHSPFGKPLVKDLNRYPKESLTSSSHASMMSDSVDSLVSFWLILGVKHCEIPLSLTQMASLLPPLVKTLVTERTPLASTEFMSHIPFVPIAQPSADWSIRPHRPHF
jgi:hypothetical protein